MGKGGKIRVIARNKKVYKQYEILETIEAGLVLQGSEIKSIRQGKVSFKDSYVVFRGNEAYLTGFYIGPYENAGYAGHDPDRDRKLLLHKKEINSLRGKVQQKGLTIIPLSVYLKNHLAKVELALAKGKRLHDQREELKRRAIQRDMAREISKYGGKL